MKKKHITEILLLTVILVIIPVSCADRNNKQTEDNYTDSAVEQVIQEENIISEEMAATEDSVNETPGAKTEDTGTALVDETSNCLGIYCFPLEEGSEADLFTHRIIEIALSEPEIAENSDRTTKYGTYFGDPAGEWCTEFALWCIIQAQQELHEDSFNFRSLYPHGDWSEGCIDWYRERKRFYRPWEILPRCGDMVFFDTDSDGIGDHTGLVVDLGFDFESEKDYIITIEGNIPGDRPSNKIRQRTIYLDDKLLLGFGTFTETDIFQ